MQVLLTSSEAVLAALPPALLAEAHLLRERAAMTQYQARGLFGGHRISSRRNNVGVGTGTGPTPVDRGVGVGAGLSISRRSGEALGSGTRTKEAEGRPLVDTVSLKAMLQLLQLAQVNTLFYVFGYIWHLSQQLFVFIPLLCSRRFSSSSCVCYIFVE